MNMEITRIAGAEQQRQAQRPAPTDQVDLDGIDLVEESAATEQVETRPTKEQAKVRGTVGLEHLTTLMGVARDAFIKMQINNVFKNTPNLNTSIPQDLPVSKEAAILIDDFTATETSFERKREIVEDLLQFQADHNIQKDSALVDVVRVLKETQGDFKSYSVFDKNGTPTLTVKKANITFVKALLLLSLLTTEKGEDVLHYLMSNPSDTQEDQVQPGVLATTGGRVATGALAAAELAQTVLAPSVDMEQNLQRAARPIATLTDLATSSFFGKGVQAAYKGVKSGLSQFWGSSDTQPSDSDKQQDKPQVTERASRRATHSARPRLYPSAIHRARQLRPGLYVAAFALFAGTQQQAEAALSDPSSCTDYSVDVASAGTTYASVASILNEALSAFVSSCDGTATKNSIKTCLGDGCTLAGSASSLDSFLESETTPSEYDELNGAIGSAAATSSPTGAPSQSPAPSGAPSPAPSGNPSFAPSRLPVITDEPSGAPSPAPSFAPSISTNAPFSAAPSASDTGEPTPSPSGSRSPQPTASGTDSQSPSASPSASGSRSPHPTASGTDSQSPSASPSASGSRSPEPTASGTDSQVPSASPSASGSRSPEPTASTGVPSPAPAVTAEPTAQSPDPSASPTTSTGVPSPAPAVTEEPTAQSPDPSASPTTSTGVPSPAPAVTEEPTAQSPDPSASPTTSTGVPSPAPAVTDEPTAQSPDPSASPTTSTGVPSPAPAVTDEPTAQSPDPSASPTTSTGVPSPAPAVTAEPTAQSPDPSASPTTSTGVPSPAPAVTEEPTAQSPDPSASPTTSTGVPSPAPAVTEEPTAQSPDPSASPTTSTGVPSPAPAVTAEPTRQSDDPSAAPSAAGSAQPTADVSHTGMPTFANTNSTLVPTPAPKETPAPFSTAPSGSPVATSSPAPATEQPAPSASPSASGTQTHAPSGSGYSGSPSFSPTNGEGPEPTATPTQSNTAPSGSPSWSPTGSGEDTRVPTHTPSGSPTGSGVPSPSPTSSGTIVVEAEVTKEQLCDALAGNLQNCETQRAIAYHFHNATEVERKNLRDLIDASVDVQGEPGKEASADTLFARISGNCDSQRAAFFASNCTVSGSSVTNSAHAEQARALEEGADGSQEGTITATNPWGVTRSQVPYAIVGLGAAATAIGSAAYYQQVVLQRAWNRPNVELARGTHNDIVRAGLTVSRLEKAYRNIFYRLSRLAEGILARHSEDAAHGNRQLRFNFRGEDGLITIEKLNILTGTLEPTAVNFDLLRNLTPAELIHNAMLKIKDLQNAPADEGVVITPEMEAFDTLLEDLYQLSDDLHKSGFASTQQLRDTAQAYETLTGLSASIDASNKSRQWKKVLSENQNLRAVQNTQVTGSILRQLAQPNRVFHLQQNLTHPRSPYPYFLQEIQEDGTKRTLQFGDPVYIKDGFLYARDPEVAANADQQPLQLRVKLSNMPGNAQRIQNSEDAGPARVEDVLDHVVYTTTKLDRTREQNYYKVVTLPDGSLQTQVCNEQGGVAIAGNVNFSDESFELSLQGRRSLEVVGYRQADHGRQYRTCLDRAAACAGAGDEEEHGPDFGHLNQATHRSVLDIVAYFNQNATSISQTSAAIKKTLIAPITEGPTTQYHDTADAALPLTMPQLLWAQQVAKRSLVKQQQFAGRPNEVFPHYNATVDATYQLRNVREGWIKTDPTLVMARRVALNARLICREKIDCGREKLTTLSQPRQRDLPAAPPAGVGAPAAVGGGAAPAPVVGPALPPPPPAGHGGAMVAAPAPAAAL